MITTLVSEAATLIKQKSYIFRILIVPYLTLRLTDDKYIGIIYLNEKFL